MACVAAGLMTSRPTKHAAMHLYCTAGPIEEDALLLAGLLRLQAGLQPCRDWHHTQLGCGVLQPLLHKDPTATCRPVQAPCVEANAAGGPGVAQHAIGRRGRPLLHRIQGCAAGRPPDGGVSRDRPDFAHKGLQALVSWMHAGFSLSMPDAGVASVCLSEPESSWTPQEEGVGGQRLHQAGQPVWPTSWLHLATPSILNSSFHMEAPIHHGFPGRPQAS